MSHHTVLFNKILFFVPVEIANGKLYTTEIIEYPENWYQLFGSFVGYTQQSQ